MLDEWGERVHGDYERHMKECTRCALVPVAQEPEGLCEEGRKVWQALKDFNECEM